ncbi:MAG: XdhC family protein [Pseudomonadota bacterium]
MTGPMPVLSEHAEDVLDFAFASQSKGDRVALCCMTGSVGGAVRAPGALMAVTGDGASCGYLSGGCIDADVVLRAQAAIGSGTPDRARYGIGSPFRDIALPCGGAIDVLIDPTPLGAEAAGALESLKARKPVSLHVSSNGQLAWQKLAGIDAPLAVHRPKLRIRIAGKGADPLALARLCDAAGIDTAFWTPDEASRSDASGLGLKTIVALNSLSDVPPPNDDAWTAFILMFHDPDWEDVLLTDALAGHAFYVGAVGSPKTHAARCERLRKAGVADSQIARICGPVGVLPSMRNASGLAVSALAEIIGAYEAPLS